MQEPIKQTLFRFSSTRAPELLSEEAKTNYFIPHYNGTSGDFIEAVDAMGPTDVLKDVLQDTADNFDDYMSLQDVLDAKPEIYELGLFLLKNRNTLTHAEVNTAVTGLTVYDNTTRRNLWDNLFYQTITLESGAIREAIMVMILGNYIVDNFGSIPTTDDDMRKWANARIVMPTKLFPLEPSTFEGSSINELSTGAQILNYYLDMAKNKCETKLIDTAKEEVAKYADSFFKTNNALEQIANEAHQAAWESELDGGTETDYIDQFSGYTFKDITGITEPTYSYAKPREVDPNAMGPVIDPEANYILDKYNLYTTKTFAEMTEKLNSVQAKVNNQIFDKTEFYEEKININGTLISKCGIEQRVKSRYAFAVEFCEKGEGKYGMHLVVDLCDPCLSLESATFDATVPTSSSYTVKTASNSKGIMTIDVTNGQTFEMGVETDLDLDGELTFSNGLKLSFSSITVELSSTYYGVMAVANTPEPTKELNIPKGFGVRRLGIADYRRLEQTLCCYVPGEVAHIENVMAREYKERSTRRLRRSEETTTLTSSTEQENLTDTSSTSRFDMQSEVSTVLSQAQERNKSFSFNSSTSGTTSVPLVGEVDFSLGFDTSTDFSTSNSTESSDSKSTSFAKEVTEKAVQRITTNVTEERITKIIEEFEERNQHGFDNRKGAEHISGVFRWVDKVYKNEVHNYGKRLQYEFMIPQPASFHMIAKSASANDDNGIKLSKPLDPRTNSFGILEPLRNMAHVNDTNYHQWAAAYGAIVSPPPKQFITSGKVLLKPDDGSSWEESKTVQDEILVPDGYFVDTVYYSVAGRKVLSWSNFAVTVAGKLRINTENEFSNWWFTDVYAYEDLLHVEGSIPISAIFTCHRAGSVSITVKFQRKYDLYAEWQLDTFNTIMNAYEARLQEYKDALAEIASQGLDFGENPGLYRQIENTALKKNCISYLAGHGYLGQNFTIGQETKTNQVNATEDMDKYSATAKFFEQAFEWDLMNYTFYPFYWADKDRWEELYALDNDDQLFRSFLRSGMARTVVTVRPGFEEAVMYYMATGLIWNGGEVPIIGDDLYLSIVDELKNPEYVLEESWETRVPSMLTVIQAKTIGLDADGLPCYCESGTPPTEDIVVPDPNPLTGLEVFIEGDTGA